MSFGPNVKVLGPEGLVEEIQTDLERMMCLYKESPKRLSASTKVNDVD